MISITTELSNKFERVIDDLYDKISISCIIMADLNGQLICFRKESDKFNEINLAILFASHIGTTVEISREIQDKFGFNHLLHEGLDQCLFLSSIEKSYVLGIIFPNTTQIGAVRLFAKKACFQLQRILSAHQNQNADKNYNINIDKAFVASLSDQCDNLFNL